MEYPDQTLAAQGEHGDRANRQNRHIAPVTAARAPYDCRVSFLSGVMAGEIEWAIRRGCGQVRATMPADLFISESYRAVNSDRLGIPAGKAERAGWRASEACRLALPSGAVLLATVPPPPERAGGWSMLLMAYEPPDSGTLLRGAWWIGPEYPVNAVKAFSLFVARFGIRLRTRRGENLFSIVNAGPVPPQPAKRAEHCELHALPQARPDGKTIGWAWCFGIDRTRHRDYLTAMEARPRTARGARTAE
jgi:hypothetical protein